MRYLRDDCRDSATLLFEPASPLSEIAERAGLRWALCFPTRWFAASLPALLRLVEPSLDFAGCPQLFLLRKSAKDAYPCSWNIKNICFEAFLPTGDIRLFYRMTASCLPSLPIDHSWWVLRFLLGIPSPWRLWPYDSVYRIVPNLSPGASFKLKFHISSLPPN